MAVKEPENQERDFEVTITDRFGPRPPIVVKARTREEAIAKAKANAKLQFQFNKLSRAIESHDLLDVQSFVNQEGVDPSVIQRGFHYSWNITIGLYEKQNLDEPFKQQVKILTALLDAGAKVQGIDFTNLLIVAGYCAEKEDFSLLKAIVKRVGLNNAETPLLLMAVEFAYKFSPLRAVVKCLLKWGAHPNAISLKSLRTALEFADDDARCVALLLQHGANPNIRFGRGQGDTPLLRILMSPEKHRRYKFVDGKSQLLSSEYGLVKLFIQKGAHLNECSKVCEEESVLDRAIFRGASLKTVKLLMTHHATVLPANIYRLVESICNRRLADNDLSTAEQKQWNAIVSKLIFQVLPGEFVSHFNIFAFESLSGERKVKFSLELERILRSQNRDMLSEVEDLLRSEKLLKNPAVMVMWMHKQPGTLFSALPPEIATIIAKMTLWAPRVPIVAKPSATSSPISNPQL